MNSNFKLTNYVISLIIANRLENMSDNNSSLQSDDGEGLNHFYLKDSIWRPQYGYRKKELDKLLKTISYNIPI